MFVSMFAQAATGKMSKNRRHQEIRENLTYFSLNILLQKHRHLSCLLSCKYVNSLISYLRNFSTSNNPKIPFLGFLWLQLRAIKSIYTQEQESFDEHCIQPNIIIPLEFLINEEASNEWIWIIILQFFHNFPLSFHFLYTL